MTGSSPSDLGSRLAAVQSTRSRDAALELYDGCPPVTIAEILGAWRGEGLPTGHPMDGLLEAAGWHGKRFVSADDTHPLVFDGRRGRLFSANPALVPIGLAVRHGALLRSRVLRPIARGLVRLTRTSRPRARVRMMEHRGVVTATMSYDALPINDHFRAIDPDTLLGVMDLRGVPQPFFFVLRREDAAPDRLRRR